MKLCIEILGTFYENIIFIQCLASRKHETRGHTYGMLLNKYTDTMQNKVTLLFPVQNTTRAQTVVATYYGCIENLLTSSLSQATISPYET